MSYFKTVACLHCGRSLETNFYDPCPFCAEQGHNLNYETKYDLGDAKFPGADSRWPGIFRFRDFYPIGDNDPVISLNEGNTPLVPLERLGKELGLNNLYMKDESKNPTFSHKDRMLAVIISRAVADHAPGVTVSSTGNQGAAAAAYAAVAKLPCFIFTTPNVSETMKTFMQVYGACVFVTSTMQERGVIMGKCVRELGFVPCSGIASPPIGSSCFGVDGYKSIAFELYEQLNGRLPDWMVVPISHGDAMYGMSKGMSDLVEMGLAKMPRIAAAETYGPLKATLAQGATFPVSVKATPSIQTSIATPMTSYQAVQAIRKSNGAAESTTDEEALAMQKQLARTEGVYAEAASVTSLVAARKLREQKKIDPDELVVVMITSTGLKDPAATRLVLPDLPQIKPCFDDLKQALEKTYHLKL